MTAVGPGDDFIVAWQTHYGTPSNGFVEVDASAVQWSKTGEGKFYFDVPSADGFGLVGIQAFIGAPVGPIVVETMAWVFMGQPEKGDDFLFYTESEFVPTPSGGECVPITAPTITPAIEWKDEALEQ
jgi:hypothetical protein